MSDDSVWIDRAQSAEAKLKTLQDQVEPLKQRVRDVMGALCAREQRDGSFSIDYRALVTKLGKGAGAELRQVIDEVYGTAAGASSSDSMTAQKILAADDEISRLTVELETAQERLEAAVNTAAAIDAATILAPLAGKTVTIVTARPGEKPKLRVHAEGAGSGAPNARLALSIDDCLHVLPASSLRQRIHNILRNASIRTLGDLASRTEDEIRREPNCGKACVVGLKQLLHCYALNFRVSEAQAKAA